jgi:hypothetical protein
MMGGTSPAITLLGGGNNYEVAFQANTSHLWTVGSDDHGDWHGTFVSTGTSPTDVPF